MNEEHIYIQILRIKLQKLRKMVQKRTSICMLISTNM